MQEMYNISLVMAGVNYDIPKYKGIKEKIKHVPERLGLGIIKKIEKEDDKISIASLIERLVLSIANKKTKNWFFIKDIRKKNEGEHKDMKIEIDMKLDINKTLIVVKNLIAENEKQLIERKKKDKNLTEYVRNKKINAIEQDASFKKGMIEILEKIPNKEKLDYISQIVNLTETCLEKNHLLPDLINVLGKKVKYIKDIDLEIGHIGLIVNEDDK